MNKKRLIVLGFGIFILAGFGFFSLGYYFPYFGDTPNYKNSSFCPKSTQMIIEKYAINKDMIENCLSQSFMVDGKAVEFVELEYGVPNDCPAGCLFSHFCAIVEDDIDYPVSSYFYNEEENMLNVNGSIATYNLKDLPMLTGRDHKLTSMPKFIEFLENEDNNDGKFRFCARTLTWTN